jgi:hypothetical protein
MVTAMNTFERQRMIEQLRESSDTLRADIAEREQQLADDPLAFDEYVRALCAQPVGSPVVRAAGPAAGLATRMHWWTGLRQRRAL